MTVAMVCQTVVDPPKPGVPIARDDILCKIVYVSQGKQGFSRPYEGSDQRHSFSEPWRLGSVVRSQGCVQTRISSILETFHRLCALEGGGYADQILRVVGG